jgi:uncharacterized protein YceK
MITRIRRWLAGLMVAALAATGGCASTIATAVDGKPYEGTKLDALGLALPFMSPSPATFLIAPIALADLPATIALDTLLLPYTASK